MSLLAWDYGEMWIYSGEIEIKAFFFFLNLQDPRQESGEEDLLWGKQIHLHWTEDTLPLLE